MKTGRLREVMKKLKHTTYELGENCLCKRFKCFEVVVAEERKRLIREFNGLGSYNSQSMHLSSLMTILPVERRRSRKSENKVQKSANFNFRVRVFVDGVLQDVPVCMKAFIALHGVTPRRIQTLRDNLLKFGEAKKDMRGTHKNRPRKLPSETVEQVCEFLKSLRGRKSHYSLHDSKRIYLPENLNIKKLHEMYSGKNGDKNISYESFRTIFESKFNIGFGYPRKDTCSSCDLLTAEENALKQRLENNSSIDSATENSIKKELEEIKIKKQLHLRKAEQFYEMKKMYRKKSVKSESLEAIAIDYQKNLPTPNITTNDVYFRRQLNFISFNVHVLSNGQSIFYTYDESVAHKGADEVCSMLHHFINIVLSAQVRQLVIFCDSCAGQNKNLSVFRFLFQQVLVGRFDQIQMIFPIRGHSYLECDKNMSLVKSKSYTETPDDWREIIKHARSKPTPFVVVNCEEIENFFKNWSQHLNYGLIKSPLKTRPIRILSIIKEKLPKLFYKNSYYGSFTSCEVNKPLRKNKKSNTKDPRPMLKGLYSEKLCINAAKHKDLQHLCQFLIREESRQFYKRLKPSTDGLVNDDEFIDDPPIDEGD